MVRVEILKILHEGILSSRYLRRWIEQSKVVLTLLDGPKYDKNTNVIEVLAEEHLPHFFAYARPHKSAIAVYHRVDCYHNVNRQNHSHY